MTRRFRKRWAFEDVWNHVERALGVGLMTLAAVMVLQVLGAL